MAALNDGGGRGAPVWAGLGLAAAVGFGLGLFGTPIWVAAAGVAGYLLVTRLRPRSQVAERRALVDLWQRVGWYLTAGLSLWQALEWGAREAGGMGEEVVALAREFLSGQAVDRAVAEFLARHPLPESEIFVAMLWHGFRHGLEATEVSRLAEELGQALDVEEEVAREVDPLWLSALPAVLLSNLLVVVGVPLAWGAVQGWRLL